MRKHQSGASLVEVMVAVVILGLGLIGVALLQTTSMRLSQDANHSTIATNLAYEMIDMVRSNRVEAARYDGISVSPPTGTERDDCVTSPTTGTQRDRDAAAWACEMWNAIPGATGTVDVDAGLVTVTVVWSDERLSDEAGQERTFEAETRL